MRHVVFVLVIACSANAATYRGAVRSDAWIDRAFLHFRTRVANVDGKWIDVSWAKRYVTALPPLTVARVHCRALRETPDGLLVVVAVHDLREVNASTAKRASTAKPKRFTASGQRLLLVGVAIPDRGATLTLAVVAVGKASTGVYRCIIAPKDGEPLTRQQFLNMLASGYRLYEWRESRKAVGSGSIPIYRKRHVP